VSSKLRRVLVLGINHPPEPSGISPYTGSLAQGLTKTGYKVRVLTTHPHYPQWTIADGYGQWRRQDDYDGTRVDRLLHYVPRRPSGLRRVASEASFGARLVASRWGEPSAIIAVSPALISTALARARSLITHRKIPFVVWVQDLYSLGMSETGQGAGLTLKVMQIIEGWVLRNASQIVVIHERFARRVSEDFNIPPSRITVIRNWTHLGQTERVDPESARAGLGWSPDETIVLHAGNMGVKQGLDNVVEAARLADAGSHKVRFVFLGAGSDRARLVALADGIESAVFMDSLPDAEFAAALQSADILLVNEKPGVSEMAVPSKLTSYFSAGRPVLAATDLTGITAEELRNAGAGVVVPAGDPHALIEGVRAIASDPARAREYGANGQRFRATVLDETTAIDAFDSMLSSLIDGDDSRSDRTQQKATNGSTT